MKHFEDVEEEQQADQSTTGWESTPLPEDHWSLRPEWTKYKAGLSETEKEVERPAWASALCGIRKEENG